MSRFYWRRTVRIFVPFYFLIWIVAMLASVGWLELNAGDVPHALTYTMNYYPQRLLAAGALLVAIR